ncbi:aminotransferase class I/II-fold pyridoxal phosphate-dependent enzyme [Streptomyces sp. RS10V-4]|uniref:aminotransferase class I/II-fold pyridoxal phosphate-dependent enzyme n=1 Tax=Streptomyces rhizoryzae TaxID=2932493 RepID=UPI0020066DC6|nr:aminotransferase class I/II-fold pyridoxal phosphate-dependent enzyme [Streptomyces rhizoryzae]MCK7624984.1 aminotransferase class I/II-fold pyridoxal phosphate-dependent enzyme [Streptomyces rhizoryzae]
MQPARSAFARLRHLLQDVPAPPGLDPVQLHLGESRLDTLAADTAPLADPDGWTRYPRPGGTPALRTAYHGWLARRFGVRRALADGRLATEPTPGTKQALAVALAQAVRRHRGPGTPAVILPNPFYPTYLAATEEAGARPVFYTLDDPADPAPLAAALDAAGGHAAAVIVCNPGNPRGEILPAGALARAATAAAAAGALLLVDECYTDLSYGPPPPGYLTLTEHGTGGPGPFLVLHSLSKRSRAPGLRSGFAAGDPATVADYARYNHLCGVSTPLPVCDVAAALWSDDTHVRHARGALAANWDAADTLLAAVPGYRRAEAGFFLWLPVGDDETTARRLWRDHALTAMPGRYLAADGPDGHNPGTGHLRIALVHDRPVMRQALDRLRDALTPDRAHR